MELVDLGGNPMITDSKCLGIELHDMLFTNITWSALSKNHFSCNSKTCIS